LTLRFTAAALFGAVDCARFASVDCRAVKVPAPVDRVLTRQAGVAYCQSARSDKLRPAAQPVHDHFPGGWPAADGKALNRSVRRYGLFLVILGLYLAHNQKLVSFEEPNFFHFDDGSAGQDTPGSGVIGMIIPVRFIILDVVIGVLYRVDIPAIREENRISLQGVLPAHLELNVAGADMIGGG